MLLKVYVGVQVINCLHKVRARLLLIMKEIFQAG